MLYHWKTAKVIALLQAACPTATLHNTGQGGDYDTDNLLVEVDDENRMFVTGFNTDEPVTDPSDAHVEAIVVSGGRGRGGLTSNDPDAIDLYCAVRKAIGAEINGTVCFVANHHDELF